MNHCLWLQLVAVHQHAPVLAGVFAESSGSFDHIHTAAAMIKCATLSQRERGLGLQLFRELVNLWDSVLPEAQLRTSANALWAFAKLPGGAGDRVWRDTPGRPT